LEKSFSAQKKENFLLRQDNEAFKAQLSVIQLALQSRAESEAQCAFANQKIELAIQQSSPACREEVNQVLAKIEQSSHQQ
jgi:hypothetical protein